MLAVHSIYMAVSKCTSNAHNQQKISQFALTRKTLVKSFQTPR